ncbi:hypothetical protein KBD81_01285 [Candidatus Woesebacteria bacterium]|nr:hypothetical protein [Candidatus Woesebacteria bacterium]
MIFTYKNTTTLTDSDIQNTAQTLDEYQKQIASVIQSGTYDAPECTVNLPTDEKLLEEVNEMVSQKKTNNLKYIVIIGIGGSNLGTKAVYDAFFGHYDNLEPERFPKIIFLDTQDERILKKTIKLLSSCVAQDEILINVISKSGGTTETMANLELLSSALSHKFPHLKERMVFTTVEGSLMHKKAQEYGIHVLFMPEMVGGRYSIFSSVGLFPLALCGFDLKKMRRGAANMRDICGKRSSADDNPAMTSASILYLSALQNKKINDNFIFLPQLESLGKWYRQLMGESIGKEGKGITPTVSMGSVDLHSMAQLYLDGPNDKITTFITGASPLEDTKVPGELEYNIVPSIQGKKIHEIMQAIVGGTLIAYKNQNRAYMHVGFEKLDEESLGEFMHFKMIEMMYLGKLFQVNTFDQPAVEIYKVETKKILEE